MCKKTRALSPMMLLAVVAWGSQGIAKESTKKGEAVARADSAPEVKAADSTELQVRALAPVVPGAKAPSPSTPAKKTLRFNYRVVGTANDFTGYFVFRLEGGQITVEHGSHDYFGFPTPHDAENKLSEIPFPIDFVINHDIALTSNELRGRERVTFNLPDPMPTILIRGPRVLDKHIIFDQNIGFLTDSKPLAPKVGDRLVLAHTFELGFDEYIVEARAIISGGTEIFKIRNPRGEVFRLSVASPSDKRASTSLHKRILSYVKSVARGGSASGGEMISTGANFVLEREKTTGRGAAACASLFKP
jgi:hypothetical protein